MITQPDFRLACSECALVIRVPVASSLLASPRSPQHLHTCTGSFAFRVAFRLTSSMGASKAMLPCLVACILLSITMSSVCLENDGKAKEHAAFSRLVAKWRLSESSEEAQLDDEVSELFCPVPTSGIQCTPEGSVYSMYVFIFSPIFQDWR